MQSRYDENNLPTVSGGKDGNPPDRYDLIQLAGNKDSDLAAINALADKGYRFVAELSTAETATDYPTRYVLMGNYKENK